MKGMRITMKKGLALTLACTLILAGCASPLDADAEGDRTNASASQETPQTTMSESTSTAPRESSPSTVLATLNGVDFAIELAKNDTAAAFAQMLPLQVEMSELHGNEKYAYLNEALPSHATSPGTIEAGDVMLYGDNCLVVFYETHATSYTYTRIGRISDVEGLRQAVGTGSIDVSFALE